MALYDFAAGGVFKLRAENVVLGHDSFQGRLDNLNWRGRKNVEIKVESVDATVEDLVNLLDVFLQANPLAHFNQISAAHARVIEAVVNRIAPDLVGSGFLGAVRRLDDIASDIRAALEHASRSVPLVALAIAVGLLCGNMRP